MMSLPRSIKFCTLSTGTHISLWVFPNSIQNTTLSAPPSGVMEQLGGSISQPSRGSGWVGIPEGNRLGTEEGCWVGAVDGSNVGHGPQMPPCAVASSTNPILKPRYIVYETLQYIWSNRSQNMCTYRYAHFTIFCQAIDHPLPIIATDKWITS